MGDTCPFCRPLGEGEVVVSETCLSIALLCRFPVSDGHTLVVPRRHAEKLEMLSADEWFDLVQLAREVMESSTCEDFNIGMNLGQHAGQSVAHIHMHVIPRRQGDHPDPRGGIRNVLPNATKY